MTHYIELENPSFERWWEEKNNNGFKLMAMVEKFGEDFLKALTENAFLHGVISAGKYPTGEDIDEGV